MLIIGEKINQTLRSVREFVSEKNMNAVCLLARQQAEAGANYIDLLAEPGHSEVSDLTWMTASVSQATDIPVCLDSTNPRALSAALNEIRQDAQAIINSVSLDDRDFREVLPVAMKSGCKVIALCRSGRGLPETARDRVSVAEELVKKLRNEGVRDEDILLDILVRPVSAGSIQGEHCLRAIAEIRQTMPSVGLLAGVSIISQGSPARRLLNQSFLVSAMSAGLDSAILDPMDKRLMSLIYATEAMLGKDSRLMNYTMHYREGSLEM